VVQAHQVEDRGVQVVDVHAILHGLRAKFVSRAADGAALDHPHPPQIPGV
jgi:hypothetical protein